jgi:DNA-binding MarR family transcriptional regulator
VVPVHDPAGDEPGVDPAAIELPRVSEVTIDVTQLLQRQAASEQSLDLGGLVRVDDLADSSTVAPLLGLIARSVRSALDILELDHLRILMLLSQRDGISLVELSRLTALPARKLAIVLDAMESAEWITTSRPARGIGEAVAISATGSVLIERVIRQRQDEIDEILARMSGEDRATLARAFSSFAAAAAEPPLRPTRKGIKP